MLTLSILKMYFTLVGPVILLSSIASHMAYQDGKFVLFTPVVSEYASCIYVAYQDVSSFFSPVVSEYTSRIYIYILIPLR